MKNIIFDIGNVLLDFQPEKYLQKYFNKSVMGDLMMIIFSSDEWIELDMGTMMIQDAIESLTLKHPHYHDEIIFVMKNWTHMMTPLQKNVEIVKELKEKGYHLYLLSNFHKEAIQTMFQRYEFFQLFEGGIISANEQLVKPDQKIYQLLLQRYHLQAEESLFIDDMLANVKMAQELHIHGLYLPYQTDLREELETTKYMFFIFKKEKDEYIFKGIKLWNMPETIIDTKVKGMYNKTKKVIETGNIVNHIDKRGRRITNFPGMSDNGVCHVRPHGRNAQDTLSLPVEDKLTGAKEYTKQCFWINNSYLKEIIKEFI